MVAKSPKSGKIAPINAVATHLIAAQVAELHFPIVERLRHCRARQHQERGCYYECPSPLTAKEQ